MDSSLCSDHVSGWSNFVKIVCISDLVTTDVDIVFPGPVEEPVEDKQNPQRPESQEEDEDEDDTDTDDGAVGENKDDGSLSSSLTFLK